MKKKFVSCFDIGEVPRSPGKWNWNWLYFLPFIFTFEQGAAPIRLCELQFTLVKSSRIYTGQYTFPILLLNDDNMLGEHKGREKDIVYGRLF